MGVWVSRDFYKLFLRKIVPGGISDSFGIEVAASTGFPRSVINRSKEILLELETNNRNNFQPNLFSVSTKKDLSEKIIKKSETEKRLETIDPENLSPREALEILFELKKIES